MKLWFHSETRLYANERQLRGAGTSIRSCENVKNTKESTLEGWSAKSCSNIFEYRFEQSC